MDRRRADGNSLCLLIGATGKSAQLPLYVWLPDAMEGPTPVSALIHAATMVTAGVYMIARTHFLFDRSPLALVIVAIIGAATALFAATIGLVQTDIKRVLAYSTISQLGYMFLGCGVAAYSAGIFHLMTHAFFKALLFLAAGSVIHGLGGEQDMRQMGGLRKQMPVTFWTMTAAVLAISGFFPFAGFFSKDAILYAAFLSGPNGKMLVVRLGCSPRCSPLSTCSVCGTWHSWASRAVRSCIAHESGWSMLGPLVILALLSLCGGWIGAERMGALLAPSVGTHAAAAASSSLEWILSGLAMAAAALGWLIAHMLYREGSDRAEQLAASFSALYKLLLNKYCVDEIYGKRHRKAACWQFRVLCWSGSSSSRCWAGWPGCFQEQFSSAARYCSDGSRAICARMRHGWRPARRCCCCLCWCRDFARRAWDQLEVGGMVRT